MQSQPRPGSTVQVSRRILLSAVGSACVTAAIAACSADPTPPVATTTAPEPAGGLESPPGSPDTTETVTKAAPQKLAITTEVPVGGGVVVSGILIVQPFPGLFKAFDARCPHLAAIVSPPRDGVITCQQHNSRFVDVDGARIDGPAPRGLKEVPIDVEGTTILRA